MRTREPHPGRKTKHGRHRFDTPWREPRMLVIDVLDRQGRTDRRRLPLYDVLLDHADATETLLIGYLRLLGAARAEMVAFIDDSASWIWQRSERIRQAAEIPAQRWVEVSDFYHASEHLYKTIELCRDQSAAERTEWYKRLRHTLRTDPAGVDKVIEALKPEARGRPAKKMTDAIDYFDRHRERMRYATMDRRRLPVGSGPVESVIRRVINLRFKAPSIFWEADTVGDLIHLRAAFKAGRWDELIERERVCVCAHARESAHAQLPCPLLLPDVAGSSRRRPTRRRRDRQQPTTSAPWRRIAAPFTALHPPLLGFISANFGTGCSIQCLYRAFSLT